MQKYLKKIIFILLALLPIIDLITGVITRFFPCIISIGVIVKGFLSFFCVYYVFFMSKSKYKKNALLSYLLLMIFSIMYLLTKYSINEFTFLFKEIVYLFKYFYVFIIYWGLLNIFDDLKIEKEYIKKVLLFNLLIYILAFSLSYVTRTGFLSYTDGHGGNNGWFYAANEVGASLTCLMPIVFLYFKDKKNYIYMLLIIPAVFVMSSLGTKVGLLGLAINLILISSFYVIKNYKSLKRIVILVIIIVSSILICSNSATLNNVESQFEQKLNNMDSSNVNSDSKDKTEENGKKDSDKAQTNSHSVSHGDNLFKPNSSINNNGVVSDKKSKEQSKKDKIITFISNSKYISLIFSSRETYFIETYLIYDKAGIIDKMLGLGFFNRKGIDNQNIEKLIEIDVLDIFFHFGIIGFILYFGQLFFIIYLSFHKECTNNDRTEKILSFTEILLLGGISSVAGHVLGAPAVSIYIVEYLLINILFNPQNNISPKKISFLALHLNFGGVESSIANQANFLSEKYDVEIISIYKMSDKPAFKINDKVKITYLTNLKPNREEFKKVLKSKRIIKILKEGLKSMKILYLKKYKMIDAIKNSNSRILISTRVEIAELLKKYKRTGVVSITEEHVHHNNNNKYIKRLKKACKGLDYLVCVSKELTDFYRESIPNISTVYIPNSLDFMPNKLSKLNNKKLISVGRLSPEKGYLDLIDVFYEMHKLDEEYTLDIIGDGIEKKNIQKKIELLELDKSITLHGFQSKEFIYGKLEKSSLYLMCSYEESFGIVLIEAGAFGVPQIAFDSAQGAHEIIKNNETGYLIKNRDKKEFAKRAHEIINNKNKLSKLGKSANKKAMEFSYEKVKEQWIDFIERIL